MVFSVAAIIWRACAPLSWDDGDWLPRSGKSLKASGQDSFAFPRGQYCDGLKQSDTLIVPNTAPKGGS